jgi:hypothetical protein
LQAIIGFLIFGVASYLWYKQCRRIFLYAEPEHNFFFLFTYLAVGMGIILFGGGIIYRRLTTYRLMNRYFRDSRFDMHLNPPSAIVASVTSIASGCIILLAGVHGLHWVNSFGPLDYIFSPRYGFALGIGMTFFSLVISLVLTIVTHG